jgi:hypothetical protein
MNTFHILQLICTVILYDAGGLLWSTSRSNQYSNDGNDPEMVYLMNIRGSESGYSMAFASIPLTRNSNF